MSSLISRCLKELEAIPVLALTCLVDPIQIQIQIFSFVVLRLLCAFPVVYKTFCAILIGVYDLFKL